MYPWHASPWEILREAQELAGHLKESMTIQDLEDRAPGLRPTIGRRKKIQIAKELLASIQTRRST